MSAIITWFVNIAKGIAYWFLELFKEIVKITTTLWGIILIIFSMAYLAFQDAVGAIQGLLETVGAMSVSAPNLAASAAGGFNLSRLLMICNTFAPLDELCQYLSAYLVIMGAWGVYKLLKSWLPSIFGISIGQGSGT